MTDVRLYQTEDGGEVAFVNGQAIMADGLETAAYLSMFGGNEADSGLDDGLKLQWWGNLSENDPARRYRSETQYLLRSIAAIPANLRRIEDAAKRDLEWMSSGLAESVDVTATMPSLNRVDLLVVIVINDRAFAFAFTEAWRATQ